MQHDRIDTIITQLRELHPELQRPLTWHGLRRVLRRERIELVALPLAGDAKVLTMGGVSVIAVNSSAPARRHTYFAAHEYAHIKLHGGDEGVVFNMSPCWPDDPREDDAEYFATQLLMGPAGS